ncbi:hypothetical protein R1sor_011049 [Riccia sorocarpa]|uniref:Uncharacterized protein n=1 Tax=Riccia sorocarpa TaxID=122646 RepID=A0ABD3HZR8_9MARC
MSSSNTEAKERAVNLIRSWCNEKGTEVFVDHLLKLLDLEYLRTWEGLKHIPVPDVDDLGPSGEISTSHWRYRFYHGLDYASTSKTSETPHKDENPKKEEDRRKVYKGKSGNEYPSKRAKGFHEKQKESKKDQSDPS